MQGEVVFPEDEEVGGIQFARLLARKPTLGPELSKLRAQLQEQAAGEAQEMKVWTMRDLGLQTLQAMADSASPETKMIDIVQNFPMRAPALSSIKVAQALRDDIDR